MRVSGEGGERGRRRGRQKAIEELIYSITSNNYTLPFYLYRREKKSGYTVSGASNGPPLVVLP